MAKKSFENITLETDFQDKFLKRLRAIPHTEWYKLNDRVTKGLPDIVGCAVGKFISFELKVGAKLEPMQAYRMDRINGHAQGDAFVVTPENAESILKKISDMVNASDRFLCNRCRGLFIRLN